MTFSRILAQEVEDGAEVWFFAQIDSFKTVKTKAGKEMGYLSLSDISGGMEGVIFPNVYARMRTVIAKNAFVFLRAKVQYDESRGTKLLVEELRHPTERELQEKILRLYLKLPSREAEVTKKVLALLEQYPGVHECILYFADTKKSFSTLNRFGVDLHNELLARLKEQLNDGEIVIK